MPRITRAEANLPSLFIGMGGIDAKTGSLASDAIAIVAGVRPAT